MEILLKKYELGKLLGQGTFAKVYHARDLKTLQSVAIKVIDKKKVAKAGLIDQIKREISIMRMVKHPHIVYLHEVMATKSKIFFVMEYVKGGELFKKVAKGRLKEDAAHKFFCQLIMAVNFCHGRGVYHRDLKPENLLLDGNGNLKVSDFGLSALTESTRQDGLLHTTCGTPAYVAPEVIQRKGYDGAKADVWSCGVILYVLLSGYLPFHDTNLMEMYRKINNGEFKFPSWVSSDLRSLISKILNPDPISRISMDGIMDSLWFKKSFGGKKAGGDSEEGGRAPAGDAAVKPITAFDIISLSPGFDLSGLFEKEEREKRTWFFSNLPAMEVISKLEAIAERMKMKVTKKDGGFLKIEGELTIDVEIFEVNQGCYLVEMKKVDSDTTGYRRLWSQPFSPSLKDIVWALHGQTPCP